jgi:hypothetical protein
MSISKYKLYASNKIENLCSVIRLSSIQATKSFIPAVVIDVLI